MEKACCITGHRKIPADKLDYVTKQLTKEIEQAISAGFNTFITGMAEGADLLFAQIIIEKKKTYPHLFLEAAIPYGKRAESTDKKFCECLKQCNGVFVCQDEYTDDCFFKRNRCMVNISSRVIAVYDGRNSGGTFYTISFAHTSQKEIKVIRI